MNPEAALIGSLVIDPEATAKVSTIVQSADFEDRCLAAIYEAALALHARKETIDYITLLDEIEWTGALDPWGKTKSLRASIVTGTINQAPTSLHAESYARIIARRASGQRPAPVPRVRPGDVL